MSENYNMNGNNMENGTPPEQDSSVSQQGSNQQGGWRPPYQGGYQPYQYTGWQSGGAQQNQGETGQAPHRFGTAHEQSQEKNPYQWNFDQYQQASAAYPRKKRKGLVVFSVIMASVVVISLVSFGSVSLYSNYLNHQNKQNELTTSETIDGNKPGLALVNHPEEEELPVTEGGKLTTEQIVEKVGPSIVAITTYVNYQNYQASAMGSGIIMEENGYIVTNAHVVANAAGITVRLSDGQEYEGRLVGADTKTDLAVIKIDATGLPVAEFGNSDQLKVGEPVVAIGNPQSLEFAGSVTQGIVSGLNRSLSATDSVTGTVYNYDKLIQTDAAINHGNSGGALVNEYGQVIGINSAGFNAQEAVGMNFAIPSSEAKPIIDDLIQYGYVTGRVLLGVTASTVDEVLARLNNVPTGLYVRSTLEGSDISKQGVVPGDIITKVDDQEITDANSLSEILDGKNPGDQVKLEVYRPGRTPSQQGKFFEVTIALMEDNGQSGTVQQEQQQQQEQQLPSEDQKQDPWQGFFDGLFG